MPQPTPDSREFEALVSEHEGFVKTLAARLAPLPGAGEDIAQEVFLEFVAKAGQWDLAADVRPLLAGMTRNVALRHWRERTRRLPDGMRELADYIRTVAAAEPEPASWFGEGEKRALRHCMEKLPARGRELVGAHYGQGVSSAEMSGRLGMTAAAVRRALFRLRGQLRRCIRAFLAGGAGNA